MSEDIPQTGVTIKKTDTVTIPPKSTTPIGEPSENIPEEQEQKKFNPNPGRDIAFQVATVSKPSLIKLEKGIHLYYGSKDKNMFDPDDIKLSDGTLLALFSNSPKLSADLFMNCANFPKTNGYLHKFITKSEIPLIKMISVTSLDKNSDLGSLEQQFCLGTENPRLNGFAYAIKNKEKRGEEVYDYIIGLCNPNEFLQYVATSICVNPYRLSYEIDTS